MPSYCLSAHASYAKKLPQASTQPQAGKQAAVAAVNKQADMLRS